MVYCPTTLVGKSCFPDFSAIFEFDLSGKCQHQWNCESVNSTPQTEGGILVLILNTCKSNKMLVMIYQYKDALGTLYGLIPLPHMQSVETFL